MGFAYRHGFQERRFAPFRADYRKLNAITMRYYYPIPRMYESTESLGDAEILNTLDASSGYRKIKMNRTARDLTTRATSV